MWNRMMIRLGAGGAGGAGPLPTGKAAESVCIPNIDTVGRRQRLASGVIELAVGLGILGVLLALHVHPLWRLPLVLVFWGAAIGFFQWRDRT